MQTKLGVIAGGGDLPARICQACVDHDRPVFAIALKGQADLSLLQPYSHVELPLGSVGGAIERFKAEGVEEIVMVGRVKRPSLTQLRLDAEAMKLFTKIGMKAFGDDALLTNIIEYFEKEHGFRICSVDDVLGPTGVKPGILTETRPDDTAERDIARGLDVLRAMGPVDVGQSVVVQQGIVLGVEAIEGTDAMIARAGSLARDGAGAVLVKMAKPDQDTRVDMPTIGLETIRNVAAAGLRGIAIEAGRTIVVDPKDTAEEADRLGVFIIAIDTET